MADELPGLTSRLLASDPAGSGDATLSPDGRRFVISSKRSGQWDLWSYEIAEETWTRLTDSPAEDFEARWSPDGGTLVFTSTRGGSKDLWLLDLADGGLTQLTDAPDDEEYPAFSPDGRTVVYTGGPWEARTFYTVPVSGGEGRPTHMQPLPAGGACTYAPDGRGLWCHTYHRGSGDLERRSLISGEVHQRTFGGDWDYKPMASPDGRWVAFSRSREGPADIWLLDTVNGRTHPLVESPHEDRWPNWSADGRLLFFHRLVDQGIALKLFERSSGEVRTLVGVEEEPLMGSFDADGERAVYCARAGTATILRSLDLRSGVRRDLELGLDDACFPAVSPDGRRLAFVGRERRGQRWDVAVVPLGSRGKAPGTGSQEALEVVGKPRWLTAGIPDLRGLDGRLAWSPDSSRLAFHGDTGPFEADLYILGVDSKEFLNLTRDAWFDEAPSFTPDGEALLFMSTRGGGWTWGFYRLSLRDGTITTLAGPDYVEKNFVRMARDGSLLWTQYDEEGRELLMERLAGGVDRARPEAGAGARWPSVSRDGDGVLFTEVERRVEYWWVEMPEDLVATMEGSAPMGPLAGSRPAMNGSIVESSLAESSDVDSSDAESSDVESSDEVAGCRPRVSLGRREASITSPAGFGDWRYRARQSYDDRKLGAARDCPSPSDSAGDVSVASGAAPPVNRPEEGSSPVDLFHR